MRKAKCIVGIISAAFVITISAATMTVFAAETEKNTVSDESSNYSYREIQADTWL